MDVFYIVIIVLIVELLICVYALIRNEWVCKKRIEILDRSVWNGRCYAPYDYLPSYDEMLGGHGFWRWDIGYYIREIKSGEPCAK